MRLVFGRDRDPGVIEELSADKSVDGTPKFNPCVLAFGAGPEGAKCGSCKHLFVLGGTERPYYKCAFRNYSHSAVTDHRVNWPACAKFESPPQVVPGDETDAERKFGQQDVLVRVEDEA